MQMKVVNDLSRSGTWGGEECIVALAEVYKCNVRVIWEDGPVRCITPTSMKPDNQITIVYRKINGQRVHYDSFLCFENMELDLTRDAGCYAGTAAINEPIDLDSEPEAAPDNTQAFVSPITHESSQYAISNHRPASNATACTSTLQPEWSAFKIGSWNVRGCNESKKREAIDDHLYSMRFGLVALQETKLSMRTCDTRHYKWVLREGNGTNRNARRLAFLVHPSYLPSIAKVTELSTNILMLEVQQQSSRTTFINVHIPASGHAEFNILCDFVTTHTGSKGIILGDFNAHLGVHDLTLSDRTYVGPRLHHDLWNDNGEELKTLMHLGHFAAKNTWSKYPSVLTTWTNSKWSSQIDHLLCNSTSISFHRVIATWVHTVATDHALLSAELIVRNKDDKPRKKKSTKPLSTNPAKRRFIDLNWDIGKVLNPDHAKKYYESVAIGSTAVIESHPPCSDSVPTRLWHRKRCYNKPHTPPYPADRPSRLAPYPQRRSSIIKQGHFW